MSATNTKKKAPKGSVTIQVLRGRLRLRWRVAGEPFTLSLGYPDEPMYRRVAELKAKEIEADILYDRFDPSLSKYKGEDRTDELQTNHQTASMRSLWERYFKYLQPNRAPATIQNQFKQVTRYVNRLPSDNPQDAIIIRDWALQTMKTDAAHRFIEQLCACCNWALEAGLLDKNAFTGLAKKIKVPKSQQKSEDDDIDPFSVEERDRIIEEFRKNKYYCYYADLVEFLFKVGCRPSEALGLQWKHIDKEFKSIRFEQALTESEDGLAIKTGLKTQKKRTVPCNDSLQSLLRSMHVKAGKTKNIDPEAFVFPGIRAKFINFDNFGDRAWKTILKKLDIRYRKPYQTRHTFITLALKTGMSVQDVAKFCGTSAEMIYRHYAGASRDLTVPEF